LPAISITKASLPNSILFFLNDFYNARSICKRLDISMLGIEYVNDDGMNEFVLKETGQKYSMQVASSGIQSAAPLLLVLRYAVEHGKYSSFVIEEPECNLYPEKQVELFNYIISSLRSNDCTMTITTHSPYLLSAMNNLLYAGSLAAETKDGKVIAEISDIYPKPLQLTADDCSVYSLGHNANGDETYCKSIIDEYTGMIDFNTLDGISIRLGDEFEKLEDINLKSID